MKSECPICENYRFLIVDDHPSKCMKCNWNGRYKLKEKAICLGCGEDIPCKSDCPAGSAKRLVKQDNKL